MGGTEAQQEVRAVLDEVVHAQNARDAERLRSLLSERPDAVHIGTDADEWWASQQLIDAVAAANGDDIRAEIGDLAVHIQGDVAWAEGRGRFTNPGGGERAVRVTGVLVREHGRWTVVQSHASIGVPNAEIFR